jgi:SAM-dependent methyltransferase
LLLRDLQHRYPGSRLTGTDVTAAIIDYAKKVEYVGQTPSYLQHDATSEALPAEDGSINLVVMVAVLHVLDNPLKVLREIHRVLADDGVFLLQDWIRTPLPQYLDQMTESVEAEKKQKAKEGLFGLFAAHNKYTVEDWQWLLLQGGMEVLSCEELGMAHFRTFACIKGADAST